MAIAESEPITGAWEQSPQWGPAAKPVVRGQGEAPLKLKAFQSERDLDKVPQGGYVRHRKHKPEAPPGDHCCYHAKSTFRSRPSAAPRHGRSAAAAAAGYAIGSTLRVCVDEPAQRKVVRNGG